MLQSVLNIKLMIIAVKIFIRIIYNFQILKAMKDKILITFLKSSLITLIYK